MYIPDKIKLLAHEYEVIQSDNLIKDGNITDGRLGEHSYSNQKLHVDTRFHKSVQESTFLHELTHMIITLMNIREISEHAQYEKITDMIATGFHAYLVQNNLDIVKADDDNI